MKITRIETVELRQGTLVHAGAIGWLWVRIFTDEGLMGLGETPMYSEKLFERGVAAAWE